VLTDMLIFLAYLKRVRVQNKIDLNNIEPCDSLIYKKRCVPVVSFVLLQVSYDHLVVFFDPCLLLFLVKNMIFVLIAIHRPIHILQ
jgi:hypothetical protein